MPAIPIIAAVAAVAGTVMNAVQAGDQADAQEKAQQQAQQNADRQAAQADAQAKKAEQDFNKQNQKRPDTSAILSAAQQAGKGGAAGTMLTGPQGVDPNTLTLGKSTLLGS